MGERKGQNKYYPPDYDPKAGGLNKFLGTHALRERAKKIHLGIIIIRFEMPYNIWCDGCKNHIGMGVRYNAEKTKVGMYYSTPVYQFRMKCHLCDNYIEIKTDPGNLDYEIVSGARRQEGRWDPTENGQIVADTKETQRRLFDDPMYKLEHVANDLKKCDDAKPRLYKLYERNHYTWDDDYTANSRLRAEFRTKKKELKQEAERDSRLLAKCSLDIELLPENDQDARLAAMMRLHSAKTEVEREKERKSELINKPALPSSTITSFGGLRSERLLKAKLSKSDLGIVSATKRTSSECHDPAAAKMAKTGATQAATDVGLTESDETCPVADVDVPEPTEEAVGMIGASKEVASGFNAPTTFAHKSSLALVCSYNSTSSDNDSE